ncbi:hypothetical protein [Natronomonas sp.]|uniref:hypothetical protein n=1 Tax=Natronomonas sp. TaxID=2184060 RepID=UPI002622C591|nr:hypothetical protein [Natronomonas sp.]
MECPRCDSPLERYALGDRSAVTCGECGYVGVPVDHRDDAQRTETWAEAVSNAPDTAAIASVTVETVDEDPSLSVVLEPRPERRDAAPEPTVVRVTDPDPALAAALRAADGGGRVVCDICGRAFDERAQLYGHLAVHSDGG